ncbi:hypothetical protein GCM10017783_12080 [Deinococcus piscis]|uniref:O-antigen ligase-related domain-containing protein n=1 Tax=Deinococcus piscis TaxID=394230 RepID=A0ABQ3K3G5_9DEIO|nr:hypothetical protein GCM10017783_12080 [Deinococcus piscis]
MQVLPTAGRRAAPALERAVIWLLGAFVAAQCFGLPLLGAGPWALWPTLADALLWLALLLSVLYRAPLRPDLRPLGQGLAAITALSALSVLLLLVMGDGRLNVALPFGVFQLFKLIQLLGVFWMAARLPLSQPVLDSWEKAARFGFLVMVVTVTWTYFSPAIPNFLGQFLPRGLGVSGPWESYYLHNERGLGTLGYNHAHVAAMVLLQGALLMMLRPLKSNTWVLLCIVLACFLSGARAGLVGALLFVLLEGLRTPLRSTLMVLLAGVLALAAMPYLQTELDSLIARQATILEAGNVENLAGRGDIWQTYVKNLAADPLRLLLGSGMGSGIANNGSNAHMMVLQVLYETGIAGLSVMLMLFGWLMSRLYALRDHRAGIALNVLIGLWATTFATETLYPNSAFGSFLPLLALVTVVALTPASAAVLAPNPGSEYSPTLQEPAAALASSRTLGWED